MRILKIISKMGYERRRMLEGMGFVSLWGIGFIAFMLYPLFTSLRISFTESTLKDILGGPYNGWDNYRLVIEDPQFGTLFVKTLTMALADIPAIVLISLLCAVLLHRKMAGRGILRAMFFVPVVIAGVVLRYLFEQQAADFSVISDLADKLPIVGEMLGSAVFDRIGVLMWRSSVEILIFLAGLQSIPETQYEAAHMDGATAWESFWLITLPYLSPIVLLNFIYATIDSFTEPLNPIMDFLKLQVFAWMNFGYAAAMSWIYFFVVFLFVMLLLAIGRRFVFYGNDAR